MFRSEIDRSIRPIVFKVTQVIIWLNYINDTDGPTHRQTGEQCCALFQFPLHCTMHRDCSTRGKIGRQPAPVTEILVLQPTQPRPRWQPEVVCLLTFSLCIFNNLKLFLIADAE